jgi:hypothetical protein
MLLFVRGSRSWRECGGFGLDALGFLGSDSDARCDGARVGRSDDLLAPKRRACQPPEASCCSNPAISEGPLMSAHGPALSLPIVRAADSGRSRETIHGDVERVE